MNHPMNKSQQENMMPASYLKYKTLVASETRCVDLLPSRPSVMFGLIGALLIAVPLPAFAESGSSDNISIALSSSVVGNPIEQDDVSNTAPGAIVDFSSCCQRANRTRRAGHIFRFLWATCKGVAVGQLHSPTMTAVCNSVSMDFPTPMIRSNSPAMEVQHSTIFPSRMQTGSMRM